MSNSNARFTIALTRLLSAIQGSDSKEHHSAYDDCLWCIATSDYEDLKTVIPQLWNEPYNQLPIPIATIICRLFLGAPNENEQLREQAKNFIVAHCSPYEADSALKAINA